MSLPADTPVSALAGAPASAPARIQRPAPAEAAAPRNVRRVQAFLFMRGRYGSAPPGSSESARPLLRSVGCERQLQDDGVTHLLRRDRVLRIEKLLPLAVRGKIEGSIYDDSQRRLVKIGMVHLQNPRGSDRRAVGGQIDPNDPMGNDAILDGHQAAAGAGQAVDAGKGEVGRHGEGSDAAARQVNGEEPLVIRDVERLAVLG